jgi:hypothetical protein
MDLSDGFQPLVDFFE